MGELLSYETGPVAAPAACCQGQEEKDIREHPQDASQHQHNLTILPQVFLAWTTKGSDFGSQSSRDWPSPQTWELEMSEAQGRLKRHLNGKENLAPKEGETHL